MNSHFALQDGHVSGGAVTLIVFPQLLHFQTSMALSLLQRVYNEAYKESQRLINISAWP
jgi:hypothetical protein